MDIQKSNTPLAFLEFERSGWSAHIESYMHTLAAVTRQTVEATLQAARVRPGDKILDLCCGPGMLSAAAVALGAHPTGLDFPDVVVVARRLVPNAQFQDGDATELPFSDNVFDAIVCGYGILHVPDPETALREMWRVLRPGGRVALSTWDNEVSPTGLGVVYKAVHDHADLTVPLPHGPNVFQFSRLDSMRSALAAIGFADVEASRFAQNWRVTSGSHFLDAVKEGTVRTRALLVAQTDEVISQIGADFERAFADRRLPDGGFDIPMPAIIGSGAKP